ncbi:hypothetical protein BKA58DRAFT_320264, partial [Alternaria rosae]|uniref:uncharacterized protein n=1 Tax=Alternaria rosae TaxID=1187941 RepID=UPI001E8D0871
NLTVRFFQERQDETCSFRNSSSALAFTTSTVPLGEYCFEMEDVFGGNTTQGFANTSWASGQLPGEVGIYWAVENADLYSPKVNYTSVLYHLRPVLSADTNEHTDRSVSVYPAKGCETWDPTSKLPINPPVPWYGFSCWGEEEGNCGTSEYGARSFRILPAQKESDLAGKCIVFAECGAAMSLYTSSRTIVGAALSASMVIWSTL